MNDLVYVRGTCTPVCFEACTRTCQEAEALKSGRASVNFVAIGGTGFFGLWWDHVSTASGQ